MELTAEAVLFDLDGTLIDSTASIVRCWLQWAGELGIDPMRLLEAHGRTSAQIVAELVSARDFAAALHRINELELGDAHSVRPMPGALELVAALPSGRFAYVTSATASLATARLSAAGLMIDAPLIAADDVTRGKPDPEPYLLGASRVGVNPGSCVVFEDAPAGIASLVRRAWLSSASLPPTSRIN